MATIDQYLSDVKSAIYGEDVRDSIVNAIKAIDTENQTLRSSVDASVQNTLENYQIYELVETLPEVGNQNKIYAQMDLETIDSDSNNSTSEQAGGGTPRGACKRIRPSRVRRHTNRVPCRVCGSGGNQKPRRIPYFA